jgi:hypothetical protein
LRLHSAVGFFSLFLLLACPRLVFAQDVESTNQVGIGVATERGYSPETGVLEDPLSAPLRLSFSLGTHQGIGIAAGGSLTTR